MGSGWLPTAGERIAHFEKAGYTVLPPGWPGVDSQLVAGICADPSSLNSVTIANVVNRYEEIIKSLNTPIIMAILSVAFSSSCSLVEV
jgi:hypothetical protein